ncbi:MAG: branched-chain amino acid ABC transporter permease [Nitrososphaerales archaeon]|nr:branched-chain amino acid ABC transporter permease [Nitrososphaerales archaeon]
MAELVQSVMNGVVQGGFFALASVGLSLIFGVQKVLNLAYGAFIVLAAFVTIQFSILITPALHIDPLFSVPLDAIVIGLLGCAVYFAIIIRAAKTGFETILLATFGLSILLEYVMQNGFGPIPPIDPSSGIGALAQYQTYSSTSWKIGPIFLAKAGFLALLAALVLIPSLHFFLSRTYFGRTLRATSQDPEAAEFSGIDTRRVNLISFVIGSSTAGVAGGFLAFLTPVTPISGGAAILPIILAIIIIGGMGSMIGTLAAGFIVGLVMNVSSLVAFNLPAQSGLHSDLGSLFTFIIFLTVLTLKPAGLFGQAEPGQLS